MKKKQSFYYFYGKKNLLKIMRLLFILMTMTSMTISASSFSQEQRVTLDVKNVGAMELFKQIQKETNLFFVYNDADLVSFNNISVSAKDEAVEILLKRTFSGLDFLFEGIVNFHFHLLKLRFRNLLLLYPCSVLKQKFSCRK